MEKRAIKAERQRDAALDKVTQQRQKSYELETALEEEKGKNLKLIFSIQGGQRFRSRYTGMSMAELLQAVWNINIRICPVCGGHNMKPVGRTYAGTS